MNKLVKIKYCKIFLYLISIISMTIAFYGNIFRTCEMNKFEDFKIYSESLVIGRLNEKSTKFFIPMSRYEPSSPTKNYNRFIETVKLTYTHYFLDSLHTKNNLKKVYYESSLGFQAFILSIIDTNLDRINFFSNKEIRLNIYRLLFSILFALCLIAFIYFSIKQFSILNGYLLLIFICCSQWLIFFSNNLYWAFFLAFLPISITIFFFQKFKFNCKRKYFNLYYFSIYLIIFIKCMCGFEYISTIGVSISCIVLYYALIEKISLKRHLIHHFKIFIVFIFGFFSASATYLSSIYLRLGSLSEIIEKVKFILLKTTTIINNSESTLSNLQLSNIIKVYFEGHPFRYGIKTISFIQFQHIIFLTSIVGLIIILFIKKTNTKNLRLHSLAITFFYSILAPLSWFILAKGHSNSHYHLNQVLWYLPTLFFAIILLNDLFFRTIIFLRKIIILNYKSKIV